MLKNLIKVQMLLFTRSRLNVSGTIKMKGIFGSLFRSRIEVLEHIFRSLEEYLKKPNQSVDSNFLYCAVSL